MELKVICKRLITQNLDGNITEGEYGADVVGISVPRMYGEHDLSEFSFRLTAVSKLNESVAEQILTMDSIVNDNIHLLWEVTSDFTASSGEVTLVLAGVNVGNTVQIKFISQPVTINDDCRLEFIESPTILEQAYNQVQLEVQKAVDAAERAEEAAAGITIPVATETEVGGIMSGGDISVDGNGACTVNSVNGKTVGVSVPEDAVFTDTVYMLPTASDTVLGGVRVDNNTIKINSDGTIYSIGGSVVENGRILSGSSSYTIDDAVDYPIISLHTFGKSIQNGTPTYENPIDIVSVGDCGKIETVSESVIYSGIELEIGGVDSNGYNIENATRMRSKGYIAIKPNERYRIYANHNTSKGTLKIHLSFYTVNDFSTQRADYADWISGNNYAFVAPANVNYVRILFGISNSTGDAVLESNDIFDVYAAENTNSAIITSCLPLCSVGNMRDELVYNVNGTATVIKRTAKLDSYNNETITTDYISSTGGLDTGAKVIYALQVPYENELTETEITALTQLKTFDGITKIHNNENAEMSVKVATNPLLSEYIIPVIEGINNRISRLNSSI